MKSNWKFVSVLAAALTMMFGVSNVFAQYGSGACDATCDVPSVSYAPTCEAPSCEPTCDVGYGSSVDCGVGYYGDSCYNDACYPDLCGLITGVLNVAASPFKWVYCELTNGIYPDCGCAPRPEKQACNPCNICGDYVGDATIIAKVFLLATAILKTLKFITRTLGYYPSLLRRALTLQHFTTLNNMTLLQLAEVRRFPRFRSTELDVTIFHAQHPQFRRSRYCRQHEKVSNVRSVSYEQQNVKSASRSDASSTPTEERC